jgi:co-chaperonin GroES (HSP10)
MLPRNQPVEWLSAEELRAQSPTPLFIGVDLAKPEERRMDVTKIRAVGPWVLVKVDQPELEDGYEKFAGSSLYKPQGGTAADRLGHSLGTVLSVGSGKPDEVGKGWIKPGVKKGDRILFRGFLQEANRPQPFDREHCFLHMDDVAKGLIVEEDERCCERDTDGDGNCDRHPKKRG